MGYEGHEGLQGAIAMRNRPTILVTGAGGFIGHHLVKYLVKRGHVVRGVDVKAPEYQRTDANEFVIADLRNYSECLKVTKDIDEIYHLAADMGGIGYISSSHASITLNNTLINVHTLHAARENGVKRFLFSSSACVYPQYLQKRPDVVPLREEDAFPADPEEGYGLEKLYTEKLCQYFTEDWGLCDTGRALPQCLWAARYLSTEAARKRPRQFAGRSQCSPMEAKSRSGAMECRRDRSCTSMTASKASIASCGPTTAAPLNLGTDELVER